LEKTLPTKKIRLNRHYSIAPLKTAIKSPSEAKTAGNNSKTRQKALRPDVVLFQKIQKKAKKIKKNVDIR
jgi:hypothetical protein